MSSLFSRAATLTSDIAHKLHIGKPSGLKAELSTRLPDIEGRLRKISARLQSWPLPAGISQADHPKLQARLERLQLEVDHLRKHPQGAATAHRLMTLDGESTALASAAGVPAGAATRSPSSMEAEELEDSIARQRERTHLDKAHLLEIRHGHRFAGQLKVQTRRLAGAIDEFEKTAVESHRAGHVTPAHDNAVARLETARRHLDAAETQRQPVANQLFQLEQRLKDLKRRPDVQLFAAELREINENMRENVHLGTAVNGGWHKAQVGLLTAQTWLERLEKDLQAIDAEPLGSKDWDRRGFLATRLRIGGDISAEEAVRMARQAQKAMAAGCPATSALHNERTRRILAREGHAPDKIDTMVGMLRMMGAADHRDGCALLRALMPMPVRELRQLATAGVTLAPARGGVHTTFPHGTHEPLWRPKPQGDAVGRYNIDRRVISAETLDRDGEIVVRHPAAPLHEAAHAADHRKDWSPSARRAFLAARDQDVAAGHLVPGRDDHYLAHDRHNHAQSPERETFAESRAMYFLGDRRWPALYAYWERELNPQINDKAAPQGRLPELTRPSRA